LLGKFLKSNPYKKVILGLDPRIQYQVDALDPVVKPQDDKINEKLLNTYLYLRFYFEYQFMKKKKRKKEDDFMPLLK
jgi:hypothetical protein